MKTLQFLIIKMDYLCYFVRDSRLFSDKEHKKNRPDYDLDGSFHQKWCERRELNPYVRCTHASETCLSAYSNTLASSFYIIKKKLLFVKSRRVKKAAIRRPFLIIQFLFTQTAQLSIYTAGVRLIPEKLKVPV